MGETKSLIAWVNFANAHNVCGTYSVNFGGSQEEEVATNCDAAAILGTVGMLVFGGVKHFVRGISISTLAEHAELYYICTLTLFYVWVSYKDGYHIPPGGNYFAKTKFVTSPQGHVECATIAAAFADFRPCIFPPFTSNVSLHTHT